MSGVKPLKPQNRAPRYVDKTPTRLRQQRLEEGDKDHYFYVSQEADDTPPKQYSKGGQGRKTLINCYRANCASFRLWIYMAIHKKKPKRF